MIFGAIGLVVVSVAGLAIASGLAVGVYERRHEFAAMQAIGARRRRLRRLIVTELLPIAAFGIGGGLVIGALGARGIIGSFEASNSIDIGVVGSYRVTLDRLVDLVGARSSSSGGERIEAMAAAKAARAEAASAAVAASDSSAASLSSWFGERRQEARASTLLPSPDV